MATFKKLKSGNWRVQVRRKGCYLSETFRRHADAEGWAIATERRIDRGETPKKRSRVDPTTFGHLIDLHIDDLKEVGKAPRRTKAFTLDALQSKLGSVKIGDLTRERLIQFGKDRAKEGADGVTISMDIGYIKLVISHAAAVHGIEISPEPVDLARITLSLRSGCDLFLSRRRWAILRFSFGTCFAPRRIYGIRLITDQIQRQCRQLLAYGVGVESTSGIIPTVHPSNHSADRQRG